MSDFCSVGLFKYFQGEFWAPSFFFLRHSDVGVALVAPPSVFEIVWISLNVNDIYEYLGDVTLGTARLRSTQDQQPRLPRGLVLLICELFARPIGSWKSPLFSLKKCPAKLNMRTAH
jgi:hypothetical protein